jgi:beta-barrel assembly-enhancing protease
MPKLAWVALLAVACGCASTGLHVRQVPLPIDDQTERALGGRLSAKVESEYRINTNKNVNQYVNQLGQKIVRLSDRPDIPYTFKVLASEREARAFALPGGHIYVTTGLLMGLESECQLAGVLAHEVGHVAAHDAATALGAGVPDAELAVILRGGPPDSVAVATKNALAVLNAGYGAGTEKLADRTGIMYAARAGLNPMGAVQVMEAMGSHGGAGDGFWEPLSGHQPTAAERVAALQSEIASMGLDAGLPSDPDPYAKVKAQLP